MAGRCDACPGHEVARHPVALVEIGRRGEDRIVIAHPLRVDEHRAGVDAPGERLTDQVLEALPKPHDKTLIMPIYDVMNLLGVDPTLREGVKVAVLKRIQEAEA